MVILFALFLGVVHGRDTKCRGLALAGGGAKGSYEAGAFDSFVKQLPPIEVAYDIITGVSAGSMNAGAMGLFKQGDEVAANDFLQQFWFNLTKQEVYTIKGPLEILFGNSVLDNEPLRRTLTGYANTYGINRDLIVGTTNFDTGAFTRFNQTIGVTEFLEAVISSSSLQLVFPPQNWRNSTWVDGGVVNNIDMMAAVNYCQEKGFADEDIIIDALFCHDGTDFPEVEEEDLTSVWDIYERVQDIKNYEDAFRYTGQIMEEFPHVHFRYIVAPSGPMFGSSLNFGHDTIMKRIILGKGDAKHLIHTTGAEGNGKEWLKEWKARDNK